MKVVTAVGPWPHLVMAGPPGRDDRRVHDDPEPPLEEVGPRARTVEPVRSRRPAAPALEAA